MAPPNDMEQIDALWATFRLPVPLATPGRYPPGPHDEWMLRAVDLLRLLHTMNEQHDDPAARATTLRGGAAPSRERVMEGQMAVATSLLAKVERTYPQFGEEEQVLRQNCQALVQKLRSDAEETCAKLQRWLDRRRSEGKVPPERDLLYEIFLAPEDPSPANGNDQRDEPLDEFDHDIEDDEYGDDVADINAVSPAAAPAQRQRNRAQPAHAPAREEALDPVEFQRQQQELLEEELASMAARLKSSTLAMNSTLQTQTKELDDFEQLAQTNLDQVADTTKKVEGRLARNRGWKKRLATWSIVGTVIGTWTLCFMVVRTVPKRRIGEVRWFQEGGGLQGAWKAGKNYLSGRPALWEEDEEEEDASYGKPQHDAREQWRRNMEKKESREQHEQQECEILGDGTQVCSDAEDDASRKEAKARELAAERRRRRIEENMANAPAVDAVDSVHDEEPQRSGEEEEDSAADDDPMGCIPPTKDMHVHQNALDALNQALENIEQVLLNAPEGSTLWKNNVRNRDKLMGQSKKHYSALEAEKNKARSTFWADKEVRLKARDHKRALGSIPFCKEGDLRDTSAREGSRVEDDESARDEEEARRLEDERRENFQEQVRLEREAQAKADAEMKRREEEKARLDAERERRKKDEEETRRLAQEQADAERLEKEWQAAVANDQAERKRLEQEEAETEEERLEREKKMEEKMKEALKVLSEPVEQKKAEKRQEAARKAFWEDYNAQKERLVKEIRRRKRVEEEEEARRLAEERERMEQERMKRERILLEQRQREQEEAHRLEQEMAAMAEEQERARQLAGLKAKAEAEAKEAMELAKQKVADNSSEFLPSDVRFAAARLKNDMLAHYISASPDMVDASDRSGWRPIHEAARAGNLAGIEMLVSAGADLTSRTGRTGNGGTALWWAVQRYGEDSDVVQLLRSHGALEAGPA